MTVSCCLLFRERCGHLKNLSASGQSSARFEFIDEDWKVRYFVVFEFPRPLHPTRYGPTGGGNEIRGELEAVEECALATARFRNALFNGVANERQLSLVGECLLRQVLLLPACCQTLKFDCEAAK